VFCSWLLIIIGGDKLNKYEINTEKKKKDVVNAALALFTEKGFTNVSIKEIAALAHVSQVTIYNYFGSKEALITECADIIMDDTVQKASDILKKDIPFTEKINLAFLDSTKSINLALTDYFTEYALNDPVLIDLLTKNINERKKIIYRKFIEYGKQDGIISNAISTDTIVDFIEALNIAGSKWESHGDAITKIQQIYHLFLYGVIGKS